MKREVRSMTTGVTFATLALGLVLGQALPPQSLAAPVASPASPLTAGQAKLSQGQYQPAVKLLEEAVKKEPRSCAAHLCLGQAYAKLKNFAKARQHLRTAIRVGQGSTNAQKANQALMSLPRTVIAPRTGQDTRMIALNLGLLSTDRGDGGPSKPTVLDFYASWCQPCKQLEPLIEKAKSEYGEQVNFVSVNVDDPNNEQIIDQYGVSPIPTLVFLSPNGEVVTYSIGFSGEQSVSTGIKKILKG